MNFGKLVVQRVLQFFDKSKAAAGVDIVLSRPSGRATLGLATASGVPGLVGESLNPEACRTAVIDHYLEGPLYAIGNDAQVWYSGAVVVLSTYAIVFLDAPRRR